MSTERRVWSVPVHIDEIPETGRHFDLHADEPTRTAVARAAAVPGIARLNAVFDVSRHGRDALCVVGRVSASVRQICVVTLEPMTSEVDEGIDLVFAPSAEETARNVGEEHGATLDASEPPEPLINRSVDLGAIAVEFLMLGIDPYPRKPGAVFQSPVADDEKAHPFAVLSTLKRQDED